MNTQHRSLPEVLEQAQAEYESGSITDATLAALATYGYSKDFIQGYIMGHAVALGEVIMSAVHDATGGRDEYYALARWAQESLPPARIASFDIEVTSGDSLRALAATRELMQERNAAVFGGS